MLNIAVFASGQGSNFEKIIEGVKDGLILGRVNVLITDRDNINAIEIAKRNDIPSVILVPSLYNREADYTSDILKYLAVYNVNFILLAGYLKKIPAMIVDCYRMSMINIHPSLIPLYSGKGYYGDHVFEMVLNNHESESGITIHFVDEFYDHGQIIFQKRIDIKQGEDISSLKLRTRQLEHIFYPIITGLFSRGMILYEGDCVTISEAGSDFIERFSHTQ